MNAQKEELLRHLDVMDLSDQDIQQMILNYEIKYPYDIDLIMIRMRYLLSVEKYQTVIELGELGVSLNPYIPEIHYYLSKAYSQSVDLYFLAFKHLRIAYFLRTYQADVLQSVDLEKEILDISLKIEGYTKQITDPQLKEMWYENKKVINTCQYNMFGYYETRFRSIDPVFGTYFFANEYEKWYVGIKHENFAMRQIHTAQNLYEMKAEFVEALEVRTGEVAAIPSDGEYIVPIAAEEEHTQHRFLYEGKTVEVCQRYDKSFQYFRVSAGTQIYSSGKCYYGNLIPVQMDSKKKKLVLSIFVDGLSWAFLQNGRYKELIPNTYKYFQAGLIFDQGYSTGEWTYPAIASLVSGLYTTEHMMFHNEIDGCLPQNNQILAQYFKQAGYYTAAIQNDWRIIPSYGHARGYDSFIHKTNGFSVENVVGDAIGQIEAMKEVNQFLWISIGTLHDIADREELPRVSQVRLNLDEQVIEDTGGTSVKQISSWGKERQYCSVLTYIDLYLGILFDYINKNFQDDEILVSLFSDHGQGYLLSENAEFLGKERSKVAYMFRGVKEEGKRISEIASIIDYTAIMCHEAEIPYECHGDVHLPRCMGGSGRKWAITESLHPGDPYRCVLHGEYAEIYFCSQTPVQHDGRFELQEPTVKVVDYEGNLIDDLELREKGMRIIMNHIAHLIKY